MLPLMCRQPYPGRVGIGPPVVDGLAPPSVLQPFPRMPCQPLLPQPQGNRSMACRSSRSLVSLPSTISQLDSPPVESRGVGQPLLPCPITPAQQSLVTGTGSRRSEMSPSSLVESPLSRPLPSPPFRGERGQLRCSPGVDEYPSLSQTGRMTPGCARKGSAPVSVNKCQARNLLAGCSKPASELTPSDKSRPAISVKDCHLPLSTLNNSYY